MSQYHNNNLIHNLRMGVELVHVGITPDMASRMMAEAGINAPAPLLAAAAEPGVLDGIGVKPFTHARKDAHIAAHQMLQTFIAEASATPTADDEAYVELVYEGDGGYEEDEQA